MKRSESYVTSTLKLLGRCVLTAEQRNLEPKFQRRLFLSHVAMVAVQGIPFSKTTQPDLTELYGNIYVDQKSSNLCVSVEGVYVEMDSELLEYWRNLRGEIVGSR